MATDFPTRRTNVLDGLRALTAAQGEVMAGFGELHRAGTADGALSAKTKELIALAISVAVRCDGCIAFHVHDALQAGATDDEIGDAVGVAVLMGGGPAAVYGADALHALQQFRASQEAS